MKRLGCIVVAASGLLGCALGSEPELAASLARPSGVPPIEGDDATFFADSEPVRCGNEPVSSYFVHRALKDGGQSVILAEVQGPAVRSLAHDGRALYAVEEDEDGRRTVLELDEHGRFELGVLPATDDESVEATQLVDETSVYVALEGSSCVTIHRVSKRTGEVVTLTPEGDCLPSPFLGFAASSPLLCASADAPASHCTRDASGVVPIPKSAM